MILAIAAFVVVFLLVASFGFLLFYRDTAAKPVSITINLPEVEVSAGLSGRMRKASTSVGRTVARLEGFIPKSAAESSAVRLKCIRAGFRSDSAVRTYYGAKVTLILVLTVLTLLTGLPIASLNYLFVLGVAVGAGFMIPDFWLGSRVSKRKREMRRELPDVLDLMVVCLEAGLSIDQAMARTAHEGGKSNSPLADELDVAVLEQKAGCSRSDAWKHLAERTDEQSVKSLVSLLVQAERFGTSLGNSMRVHAQSLRTKRVQQIEETAAKTTIKMLFPLVVFIFPVVFLVTLGPAVILMMEALKQNF